jgi:hypothetical protein
LARIFAILRHGGGPNDGADDGPDRALGAGRCRGCGVKPTSNDEWLAQGGGIALGGNRDISPEAYDPVAFPAKVCKLCRLRCEGMRLSGMDRRAGFGLCG